MTTVLAPDRLQPPAEDRRARSRDTAWWGMVLLITTEAMIFAGLLAAYFFTRAAAPEWPLGGIHKPELSRTAIFTAVLWASTVPVIWAEHGIKQGDVRRLKAGLLLAFLMGSAFVVHEFAFEWPALRFGWADNAYASLFYTITGLHGLHLIVGLLVNLVVQAKAWTGRFDEHRHRTVSVFGMYWHFVDAVWFFVFSSLYLSEHLFVAT